MSASQIGSPEILFGQVSPHAAQLFVRFPGLPGGTSWKISGRVRGPRCRHAQTLPAQYPLLDLGTGPTLLARGQITDPCCWSPELPALYQLTVEVRQNGTVVDSWSKEFGVRDLTARGASLYQGGVRRVLRGAEIAGDTPVSWPECRTGDIAVWGRHPSDEQCEEASAEGVHLVAVLEDNFLAEARRLSSWPCVAAVVVPETELGPEREFKRQLPHTLVAAWLRNGPCAERSSGWGEADLLVVEVPAAGGLSRADVEWLRGVGKPLLAWRRGEISQSLADARGHCDDLQRDLAPSLDCAGYCLGLSRPSGPAANGVAG